MTAPTTKTRAIVAPSSRRRKGTIASRYLEAIHCGAGGTVGTSTNNYNDGVDTSNARRIRNRSNKNQNNNNSSNSSDNSSSSRTHRTTNGNTYAQTQTTTATTTTTVTTAAAATIEAVAASFRSKPLTRRSNVHSSNIYDKVSAAAKVADSCSRSIVTASTAMLDVSDSISTSKSSPRGKNNGNNSGGEGSRQIKRQQRRGRSRTRNKLGTNSTSNGMRSISRNVDNNHNNTENDTNGDKFYHAPGSRSTVPLSGSNNDLTPSRQRLSTTLNNAKSSLIGNIVDDLQGISKNIMGIDDVGDDDDDGNSSSASSIESSDSTRYLSIDMHRSGDFIKFENNNNCSSNTSEGNGKNNDNWGNKSSMGDQGIRNNNENSRINAPEVGGIFPKTDPRYHSGSPGPQPKSVGYKRSTNNRLTYHHQQQKEEEQQQQQQQQQQQPPIPSDEEEGHAEMNHPSYQNESSFPDVEAEAGAPTEVITNLASDHHHNYHNHYRTGNSSSNSHRHFSVSSESITTAAPTEVVTNRASDILSRVRNNFYNEQKQQQQQSQQQQDDRPQYYGASSYLQGPPTVLRRKGWTPPFSTNNNHDKNSKADELIPSLLDAQSQSSSVSSVMSPDNPGSAMMRITLPSILTTTNDNNSKEHCSRLARHVQNARQRSILSPSASETTASFTTTTASVVTTDIPSISSIKDETGSSSKQGPSSSSLAPLLSSSSILFRNKVILSVKKEEVEVKQQQQKQQQKEGNNLLKSREEIKQCTTTTTTAATESLQTPRVWQKAKLGGLRRQITPRSARLAALAAQYRKGKFTVRGAQQHEQQQQQQDKQKQKLLSEEKEEGEEDNSEAVISNTTSQVESPFIPDPIISVVACKVACKEEIDDDDNSNDDDDDDESTIPEYIEDHTARRDGAGGKDRAENFTVYNQRPKLNAAGVFKYKSTPLREEDTKNKHEKTRFDRNSSISDGKEKSPIQPLFSLDRLDESNDSSIHESSIRSRSLGRSMTSEQFIRIASNSDHKRTKNIVEDDGYQEPQRRSKSLSQRSERKFSQSTGLSDAVRSIARVRRSRLTTKAAVAVVAPNHHRKQHVPGNIIVRKDRTGEEEEDNVLEEELVYIMENHRKEKEPVHHQQIRPYSAPSYQMSRSQTLSSSEGSTTPSSVRSDRRYSHTQDDIVTQKQPLLSYKKAAVKESETTLKVDTEYFNKNSPKETISIKDKIRAFNLKKSPRDVRAFDYNQEEKIFAKSTRNVTSMLERNEEEKKDDAGIVNYLDTRYVDQDDESSVKSLRNKLEREYIKALYGGGNDESVETSNDDYSVQSLREQLEQRISTNQNGGNMHGFGAQDDGDDDDDKSVRSLRDMFEPSVSKQNGEIVESLKAIFEPKSRVARLSFTGTKHNFVPSKAKEETEGYLLKSNWDKEEKDRAILGKTTPGGKNCYVKKENEIRREENVTVDDNRGNISKNPTTSIHNRLIQLAKLRQIQTSLALANQAEQKQDKVDSMHLTDNHSNPSYDMTPETEDLSSTPKNDFKDDDDTRDEIFRLDKNGHILSEDDNRKVPGSHWSTRGVRNEYDKSLQKRDAKGLSSDSDYSDAVTLDASICEVSFLSNPSTIRSKDSRDSKDTDRRADTNSSVLSENLLSPFSSSKTIHTQHNEWRKDINIAEMAMSPKSSESRPVFDEQGNKGEGSIPNSNVNDSKLVVKEQVNGDAATKIHSKVSYEINQGVDSDRFIDSTGAYTSKFDAQYSNRIYGPSHGIYELSSDPKSSPNQETYRDPKSTPNQETYHPPQVRKDISVSFHANTSKSHQGYHTAQEIESPITPPKISSSQRQAILDTSQRQEILSCNEPLSPYHQLESSTRSTRSIDNPHGVLESSSRSSRSMDNPNRASDISNRSSRSMDNSRKLLGSSSRSSRSMDNPNWIIDSSSRSDRSIDNRHEVLGSTSSNRSSRSMDAPRRSLESSDRSSRSMDMPGWRRSQFSNFENEFPTSSDQSPSPCSSDFQFQKDYGSSLENIWNRKLAKPVVRPSPPVVKQPVVPPMPSPFNPKYATIMESRHKMLLSRQRVLLHRRANREKVAGSQDGFFGRTYPEKVETKDQTSTCVQQNSNFSKRIAYTSLHGRESTSTPVRNNKSNLSGGLETVPSKLPRYSNNSSKERGRTLYAALEEPEYPKQFPQNSILRSPGKAYVKNEKQKPSFVSKIKTTLGLSTKTPKRTAQNQAAIDRIAAVRSARLRRNGANGDHNLGKQLSYRESKVNNNNSNNEQAAKLNTINVSCPTTTSGYMHYPHNNLDETRNNRDDDQSFSTNESNAQEYAATLAVD